MKIRGYRAAASFLTAVCIFSASGAENAPKPNRSIEKVLDEHAQLGAKPVETLTPEQARSQPTLADAIKSLLKKEGKDATPEHVASVKDIKIPTANGQSVPGRIYTPDGTGPFPTVLYIHGGGWVIADLDTYDSSPRALANAAKAVVISTHYRQAPEHKFPAAHDDTLAAYKWVLKNAAQFGGDPSRVAVAGESAGGNMAADICIAARDQGLPAPVHQLLVYPVANNDFNSASYQENANAKPLSKAGMLWFAKYVFADPKQGDDPRISLGDRASLQGLPPATIITAQIDPLREEGAMLAQKLKQAGVPMRYKNFEGVTHEFFGMGAVVPEAKEAVAFAAEGLTESFRSPRSPAASGAAPVNQKSRGE